MVYPRLVELERIFFDGGAGPEHGRRLLLRRPVGFDLHSVRDYQQGESLRRVHWPSTARRGSLMVKELEDSPARRGRRAARRGSRRGGRLAAELVLRRRRARRRLDPARASPAGPALRARAEHRRPRDADGVVGRAGMAACARASRGGRARRAESGVFAAPIGGKHRPCGLSSSWSSRRTSSGSSSTACSSARSRAGPWRSSTSSPRASSGPSVDGSRHLLRLQAAGVPIAVVRQGDELATALGGANVGEAVARA